MRDLELTQYVGGNGSEAEKQWSEEKAAAAIQEYKEKEEEENKAKKVEEEQKKEKKAKKDEEEQKKAEMEEPIEPEKEQKERRQYTSWKYKKRNNKHNNIEYRSNYLWTYLLTLYYTNSGPIYRCYKRDMLCYFMLFYSDNEWRPWCSEMDSPRHRNRFLKLSSLVPTIPLFQVAHYYSYL